MKHFDITHWADFARGVAADADRAAMEGHCHPVAGAAQDIGARATS
jgi:hypothetical protein